MKHFHHREKILEGLLKDKKRRPKIVLTPPEKEEEEKHEVKSHIVRIGSIKCVYGDKSAHEIEDMMRKNRQAIEERLKG